MSPAQAKSNLFDFVRSNPSPEEIAAKTVEFENYFSSKNVSNRSKVAKALVSHLITLVDAKDRGIELRKTDNHNLFVWIDRVYSRVDKNDPGYVVHGLAFAELDVRRPKVKIPTALFHKVMTDRLEAYKSQCKELGLPFDHTTIPAKSAIGDEEPSRCLYKWMKKVRNGGYINDPLFLTVAPRIEQICNTTLSPSMSFGELDEYMDNFCSQYNFPEETNDLETLLLRFPEIYVAKQLKTERQKLKTNQDELTTARNITGTTKIQLQAERRKSTALENEKQRLATKLELADIEKNRMAEQIAQLKENLAMATSPPAPPGWHKSYSRNAKRVWYSNSTTRHQQWHAPTEQEVLNPEEAARRARINEDHESRRAR